MCQGRRAPKKRAVSGLGWSLNIYSQNIISAMDQQSSSQNPLKQMYDEWSTKTPFVTRNSLIGIVLIYILSFFFSADVTLGNIPYFSVMHFEIYRIALAPVVGNSIMTIILMVICASLLHLTNCSCCRCSFTQQWELEWKRPWVQRDICSTCA